MHKIDISSALINQIVTNRGRRHVFDDLSPKTTALLVVDLQNGYMLESGAHVPVAKTATEIVPNVNLIAMTTRTLGGLVVWIGNIVNDEALKNWSTYHHYIMGPEQFARKLETMSEGGEGIKFWHDLDIHPEDEIVYKSRFSAFIQGASDLESKLHARDIDTVIVVGTNTGCCCESTARDAMMRNFKTIMVSDSNAAHTDEQHNAALTAFYRNFGDVMTTEELIGYMHRNASRPTQK